MYIQTANSKHTIVMFIQTVKHIIALRTQIVNRLKLCMKRR